MPDEMSREDRIEIGGAPVVTLEVPKPADAGRPALLSAQVLPGRGLMTLQVRAHLPSRGEVGLLYAPPPEAAREALDGDWRGFAGNKSYDFGGAVLLPYANRIRGTLAPDRRTIETDILGSSVRLPANAGGKRPGAEQYAMHGLLLASRADEVQRTRADGRDAVTALYRAGDFGQRWLSATEVVAESVLSPEAFTLTITARNVGSERLPMGIGWHPYFTLPSGRRQQARLHIPARRRVVVNDYDEVLPTGEVQPVAGTPYDFSMPGGRPLGDLYLDDCFVDLERTAEGHVVTEVVDPEASYGLRVVARSPHIKAFQVYSPPEKGFVVLEPQFNWADPFGSQWGADVDTGMVLLEPGESVIYAASLELFTPE